MSLQDLNLKSSYTGKGSKILSDFLLPSLDNSIEYDRITGYFTIDSLLSIANGIDSIRKKNGKMRLVIGMHSIPEEIIDAVTKKKYLKEEIGKINEQIKSDIYSLSDLLDKQKVVTIAWMIDEGLLNVKAATVQGDGIFHPKTIIMRDGERNEIAAIGSSNETKNGLGNNFEQMVVLSSWKDKEGVDNQKSFFNNLWNNQQDDAIVLDITEETAKLIKNSLGNEYEIIKQMMDKKYESNILKNMAEMPLNFFVSGLTPALYMHQERAVIDALSRWPVRVLFSDEVGLGKTFEAAATMTFLNKFCNVKRIIVLTPKSVLKQWQEELKDNFGLEVWMFDSSIKSYISSNGRIKRMGNQNPLGKGSPDIILMSAQYARGSKKSNGLLSEDDTILPDLLVVDEAHSARISEDISGKPKKTQMYKMIEAVSSKIPHMILATATPMQKNALEYHAMLKLLGLPKIWQSEQNFLDSLRYIMSDSIDNLSDANKIVSLMYFTEMQMKPNLKSLTEKEKELLDKIEYSYKNEDNFDKAIFVEKQWKNLRKLFIKIHPARLLTIRNTRRSLSEIGYKFPKRNLKEVTLYDSNKIKRFYSDVDKYLQKICFSAEIAMNPDKKLNTSFVRVSYQQRVASSLYSCKMSLKNRLDKLTDIQNQIQNNKLDKISNKSIDDIDDFDNDELLEKDGQIFYDLTNQTIDINNVIHALNLEILTLNGLLGTVDSILKTEGDYKIDESIELSVEQIKKGNQVLLFSRYTDTVKSLVRTFKLNGYYKQYNYAIYTGDKSSLIIDGVEKDCDKTEIKSALFSGSLNVVFCSDAASEGLNLQAARVLINVDVPWTPARLEQRIGRIARLGQTADEVDIYNVWYPHSVEARMYHRIQSRLKNTNIAIGEFPEVVSENIKKAILDNKDDESLEMLEDIRNKLQIDSLGELWAQNNKKTLSDNIRTKLIELCKANYKLVGCDQSNKNLIFQNNETVQNVVSGETGNANSINLSSSIFDGFDLKLSGISLKKNDSYNVGYENQDGTMMVKTESILDHMIDSTLIEYEIYENYPVMLPDANELNLLYCVEELDTNKPNYWIST